MFAPTVIAFLTAATPFSSTDIAARSHLARTGETNLGGAEIDALRVARRHRLPGTGIEVIQLQQTVDGLPVVGASISLAVDHSGEVRWSRADGVVPGLAASGERRVSGEGAIALAAASAGLTLGGELASVTPSAAHTLRFSAANLAQPAAATPLVRADGGPAWLVTIEQSEPFDLWVFLVDAETGKVIESERRVYQVEDGMVFNGQHPDTIPTGVPQTVEPFGITAESPNGWLFAAPDPLAPFTIGNNVDAKEDWVDDNEVTEGARADGGVNQEFLFGFMNSWETSADYATDRDAAITNAFYWANRWHDLTYALGFDEAAGNCQVDNFALGGDEDDPVYVDVQNRIAPPAGPPLTNFATTSVPPDGFRPRLQLYLWDAPNARVDAAFDADVILHELSHILITRMVAGPAEIGCLSSVEARAMAEGIADFFPLDFFDSTVLGEYVSGDATSGLRDFAVDLNPKTACDLDPGGSPQRSGEIIASTLWDLRTAIGSSTIQLVVDALTIAPCDPSFVDLRDGILTADQLRNGGINRCTILSAFRDRGIGFDATPGSCDPVFVDPSCSGEAFLEITGSLALDTVGGDGDGLWSPGETIDLTVNLGNTFGLATATAVSATVRPITPGLTMVDDTRPYNDIPPAGFQANADPFRFLVEADYLCGQPIVLEADVTWSSPARQRTLRINIAGGSAPGTTLLVDNADDQLLWTLTAPAEIAPLQNHTPAGTNSYWMSRGCWTGAPETTCDGTGPCNDTCPSLTSPTFYLPRHHAAELAFWSRHNLEDGFDALLVELSEDDGATWLPLEVTGGQPIGETTDGCGIGPGTTGLTGPAGNLTLTPWTESRADLSAWAGRQVTLRIRQSHDGCIYYEGAHVDDLSIELKSCQTAPWVALHALTRTLVDDVDPACTDGDGIPDPLETAQLDATLVNIGNVQATMITASLETTNPNVTGLPALVVLPDLDPGTGSAMASFNFGVGPLMDVTCAEDPELTLRYATDLPSANEEPVDDILLRGDTTVDTWRDDFEGGQAAWTATLGGGGSNQDWNLITELGCLGAGNSFWATQQSIDPAVCATGEPDYRDASDSILTSPAIDLGQPGATLRTLSWTSYGFLTTVDGVTQVLIDHDDDGTFTPVWTKDGGFGAEVGGVHTIDLTAPPDGTSLPPIETTAQLAVQFQFRSNRPDPGPGGFTEGMVVDQVELTWSGCPAADCMGCDPDPVFAGIVSATDLAPCALTGVEIDWVPGTFGPRGGVYELWRDGSFLVALPNPPPYVDMPGDNLDHDYEVRAISADCSIVAGSGISETVADSDAGAAPPPLGNVLLATRQADDVLLQWTDEPSAESYEAGWSDSRDFSPAVTVFATPAIGTPMALDPSVAPVGDIRTYRVATFGCGMTSEF